MAMNVIKIVMDNDDDVNLMILDKDYVINFVKAGIADEKLKLVFLDEKKQPLQGDQLDAFCVKCDWRGYTADPLPQFCPNCRAYNALRKQDR